MRQCWGLTRNFTRCLRKGEWRFFCTEHKRQPLVWLSFLIFTAGGGLASIYGLLPDSLQLPHVFLHPLRPVEAKTFVVAVAELENDTDKAQQNFLLNALKDFKGIDVGGVDRRISLSGPGLEREKEQKAHDQAREYLRTTKAHVLIWGKVLTLDGRSAPQLYLTTIDEGRRAKDIYQPENFKLPFLFWNELADVLRLLVITQGAAFPEGHFIADQLMPFMTKVRKLLDTSLDQQGWLPEARADVRVIFANSLVMLSEQTGNKDLLEEAIKAYREALTEYTQERVPLNWAATQDNLGTTLRALGERESGTVHLEEAVRAYHEALLERTRERVPLDWAATQNNLGNALHALGERGSGTTHLEEAIKAYREALTEYTRERVPLQWAATQNNLGTALQILGERESGTTHLEEAVRAYREALTEYTRERVPLCWAMTQNNLGTALQTLGERTKDASSLCGALNSHLSAWTVFSSASPYYAAVATNNVKKDLAFLQQESEPSATQVCMARHEELLKRMGLATSGHQP